MDDQHRQWRERIQSLINEMDAYGGLNDVNLHLQWGHDLLTDPDRRIPRPEPGAADIGMH